MKGNEWFHAEQPILHSREEEMSQVLFFELSEPLVSICNEN